MVSLGHMPESTGCRTNSCQPLESMATDQYRAEAGSRTQHSSSGPAGEGHLLQGQGLDEPWPQLGGTVVTRHEFQRCCKVWTASWATVSPQLRLHGTGIRHKVTKVLYIGARPKPASDWKHAPMNSPWLPLQHSNEPTNTHLRS